MKLSIQNKKLGFKLLLSLGLLASATTSCTDYMETLNVDKKALTDATLENDYTIGGYLLPNMQNSIHIINPEWQYQLQQNLNADVYSGYMMSPTPFAGNINNLTYFMMDGWNSYISSIPLNNVMNGWLEMKNRKIDERFPDFYAISLILKVLSMHRLTDAMGPIPYTQYGQGNNVPFDSQQEVYNAFFTELTQAVETLTKIEQADPAADARFKRFDMSTLGGDYAKWIKLANTLRLRLAIRISKVDPAKAKQEAEAAVSQSFGVLSSGEGSFRITHSSKNPVATITSSWLDILLGAPVESYLGGYNDPRLAKFAQPATDPLVKDQYKGIRQGIDIKEKTTYQGFSQLNVATTSSVLLMDVAESYFLRAEGTLRGWNMGAGTAKDFYESGITSSFVEHGLLGEEKDYLTSTATPKAYVDPKNPANNAPAPSTVTVAWEEGATFEGKLEKIITQKWIAMFPEGQEAWSEFRRTGYPKLFPVVVNNSQGEIPNGQFIKRIPYPSSITSVSPTASSEAISKYFGGSNSSFKALWWDVD
jgi:hypothetical protein